MRKKSNASENHENQNFCNKNKEEIICGNNELQRRTNQSKLTSKWIKCINESTFVTSAFGTGDTFNAIETITITIFVVSVESYILENHLNGNERESVESIKASISNQWIFIHGSIQCSSSIFEGYRLQTEARKSKTKKKRMWYVFSVWLLWVLEFVLRLSALHVPVDCVYAAGTVTTTPPLCAWKLPLAPMCALWLSSLRTIPFVLLFFYILFFGWTSKKIRRCAVHSDAHHEILNKWHAALLVNASKTCRGNAR